MLRKITSTMFAAAFLFAIVCNVAGQQQGYDISTGGQPTITGGLRATVTGSSDVLQNLVVNINFGEVTPANSNKIVKVTVPIAVRSIQPYQVSVTATSSFGTDVRMVQATDLGFGVNNMRPLGGKAQQCTRSTHIFNSIFNNDPSLNVTFNSSGRAAYQTTISNLGSTTVLLTGPKLTQGTSISRLVDDGWAFDVIFTITPQYYAAGNYSVSLTFSIAPGPTVQC